MNSKDRKEQRELGFLARQRDRQEAREAEARKIEAAKASLAKEYGLERNAKFDIAWKIAWEHGHGSGFSEVANFFSDLVPLLRP